MKTVIEIKPRLHIVDRHQKCAKVTATPVWSLEHLPLKFTLVSQKENVSHYQTYRRHQDRYVLNSNYS